MRSKIIFVATLLPQLLWIPTALAADEFLTFPVREIKGIRLGALEFSVQLLDLPDKGATGFAWSVSRDGYLLSIEIIDGLAPKILGGPASSDNQFGILYKTGANQSVLDLITISNGVFKNLYPGRISSNLACIYSENKGKLIAVSENQGQLFRDNYKANENEVTLIDTIKIPKSKENKVMKECTSKSYFRIQ